MGKVVTRYYLQKASVRVRFKGASTGRTLQVGTLLLKKNFEEQDWKNLEAKGYIRTHKHEALENKENPSKTSDKGAGSGSAMSREQLKDKTLEEVNIIAVERGRDPKQLFEDTETAIVWLTKNKTD